MSETSGTNEAFENQDQTDPWAAAFAALEQTSTEGAESDTEGTGDNGSGGDAAAVDGQDSSSVVAGNGDVDEDGSGGLDTPAPTDTGEQYGKLESLFGESDIDVEKYQADTNERLREQAINDIAAEFIKRGFRNTNGALGATINDEDICKRDSNDVPHYYNPDTGMEFRGDNPRRQANEWCEDYNKELARMFNNACAEYEAHLMKQEEPRVAVLKFKDTYRKLDPIRRGMFDNVIEDFEIKDSNGSVIGYSCDFDKALALVNRQVDMIQSFAKQRQQSQQQPDPEPRGPVVDMPASGGTAQQQEAPKSLAEAMLRLQEQQLSNLNKE